MCVFTKFLIAVFALIYLRINNDVAVNCKSLGAFFYPMGSALVEGLTADGIEMSYNDYSTIARP